MPLDFPNTPAINDTWTAGNGVTYTFDGTKWIVSGSGTGPYLLLAGGTMTGPIALAADPTTDPQAANKHYVDASINLAGNYLGTWSVAANSPNINAGGSISNANYVATTVVTGTPETVPVGVPGIAGMSVANGDRVIWAAGLGVWQILRNAGVTLAAADARYYAITNPSGYQTASQVTAALAPYAPLAAPVFTGDARAVTPTAGDNDTSIATTAFVQAAVAPDRNNAGRNLIHNSLFNVAQRGTGPWTAGGYTLDRWALGVVSDTVSITQVALSDAQRTAIGDEAAAYALRNVFTGNAAASAQSYIAQSMENVRRLAGKTVTLSFWAAAASGTPKLGVNYWQLFGTGGSPSAFAWANATGQSVTLSTTFSRYSVTTTIPSIVGKTLGTNGDDQTGLVIFFSSGATNNASAGNIGVQSGTISLWGVQLEIGSAATPLEKPDPADDLRRCQRFYQTGLCYGLGYVPANGSLFGNLTNFVTTMRATPSIAFNNTTYSTASGISTSNIGLSGFGTYATGTTTGVCNFTSGYTASADL